MEENDYSTKIKAEAEFWGNETRSVCGLGVPLSLDCRNASSIIREKGAYWDVAELDQFVRGKYRTLVIETAAKSGGKALDLCCGAGWLSLELARNGMEVTGVDVSPERIRVAAEYAATQKLSPPAKLTYRAADLNEIELDPTQYDVVTSWDGLHHVQNSERLVKQINAGLKPGGHLVLFESLHRSPFNEQIAKFLWFVLPNKQAYSSKIGMALNKLRGRSRSQPLASSPFEDSTGEELVRYIRNRFTIVRHEQCLALLPLLAGSFTLERRAQRWALHLIKFIDNITTSTGLLRGSYHFLVARKH